MNYQRFIVTIEQHVAEVRINRPEKANALDGVAWEELQAIFEHLDQQPEVRVIILSGEGKRFSAGADLEFLMSGPVKAADPSQGHAAEKLLHAIKQLQNQVSAAENCRKPVLAAIQGACIGGAVDIITACDMRYCTADAYFSVAEIDLGIVADLGTIQRLPKIIPDGIARELVYTGRRVDAAEAKEIGLVNQIFYDQDELMTGVRHIAQQIASKSPLTIRGCKEALKFTRDHTVAEGLNQVALWNAAMLMSDDLNEAFMSKMQKREAQFKD